jgi:hypothetical protein
MLRILSPLIVLVGIAPLPVVAKCALQRYTFEGQVINNTDNSPVSGARVLIFVDSSQITFTRWDLENPKPWVLTALDGTFAAAGVFNTTSGYSFLTGDRCNRRPKSISIVAWAEGYFAGRVRYTRKELRINHEFAKRLRLPAPIELEPLDEVTQ